jgi:excisionase family DNA binding protein
MEMIPQDRHVMRVDEVARVLTVSDDTVRRMLLSGSIRSLPVGEGQKRAHVRILTSSVKELLGLST